MSQSSPSQETPPRRVTELNSPVPRGPCGQMVPSSGNGPGNVATPSAHLAVTVQLALHCPLCLAPEWVGEPCLEVVQVGRIQ